MNFDSEGTLSGIPAEIGEFTFTARVTDSNALSVEKSFMLEVVLIPPPPTIRLFKTGAIPVPGREVDYFAIVENVGTVTATDILVTEFLEPWFTFISADPVPSSIEEGPDYFPMPQTTEVPRFDALLEWRIPVLEPGESYFVSYSVGLDPTFPLGSEVTGKICWVQDQPPGSCRDNYETCLIGVGVGCALAGPAYPECVAAGWGACLVNYLACIAPVPVPCSPHKAPAEGALDPNEKLVIAERYIQPDQLLVYPIHFENIGTIEARDIFITDVLDTNLDLSTLEVLTPDGASLDPATGTLRWELLNRDLLPGETDNVLLSIKPLPGLPSGTEIRNDATIQFEVFDPFTTNEVVNVIDTTRPTGIMDPLPAETATLEFPISWSGSDGVGEIDYYTVLVSEDSGDFTPFVERTSETSAIFTGESGKTYGFICIAVDTAGNIEVQEAVAEALTKVVVTNKVEVYVDIKPGSCPSPLNVKGIGVLPVAVLGTADFDVAQIDITTLWIGGVAPLRSAYEDVTTPFDPATGKEDCFEDCTYEGPDGFLDLALKFSVQEIVGALGDVEDRQCRIVKLTGTLIGRCGAHPQELKQNSLAETAFLSKGRVIILALPLFLGTPICSIPLDTR